jgi:hypothetical protein
MYEICLKLQNQVNIKVFTLPPFLGMVMPQGWGVPKIMPRGKGPIIEVNALSRGHLHSVK